MKQKMYIIRGIPGSGKSTLARSLANEKTCHFEADMYFMKNGVYTWDYNLLGDAHEWCRDNVEETLHSGLNVIVANTFINKKQLDVYFRIAKKFSITPTVILCQSNWGSIHAVPPEKVEQMKQNFEYDISSLFKEHCAIKN